MFTKYLHTEIEIDPDCIQYRGSFDPNGNVNEPEILQLAYETLKANKCKVMLDVGACTGSYALLDKVLDLQIYSFEPVDETYQMLNKNILLNKSNTFTANFAVSNYEGFGVLKKVYHPNVIALSMVDGIPSYSRKDFKESDVIVITIDGFCNANNIVPDFIKIDVEGGELRVLQGAKKTIEKYSPIILCEYSQENTNQYGYNPHMINDFLVGYDITKIGDNVLCQKK